MSANLDFQRTFQYFQAFYSVVRFSLKLFHHNIIVSYQNKKTMKIVEIGVNGMFYAMSGQNFIAKSLFLPYNIGRIISKRILRRFRRPAAELKRGGITYFTRRIYIC